MNIHKSPVFLSSAIGSFAVGAIVLLFAFGSSFEKNNDPLSNVLGDIISDSNLPADFLPTAIFSYSGAVNPSLQSCINTYDQSVENSYITAQYNSEAVIVSTKDEILDEIMPVFGHAVRNNQISWVYNPDEKKYIFETAPGDEVLWWCYLKNETDFFQSFLLEESVHASFDTIGSVSLLTPSSGEAERVLQRNIGVAEGGQHFGFFNIDVETSQNMPNVVSFPDRTLTSFTQVDNFIPEYSSAEVYRSVDFPALFIAAENIDVIESITLNPGDFNPLSSSGEVGRYASRMSVLLQADLDDNVPYDNKQILWGIEPLKLPFFNGDTKPAFPLKNTPEVLVSLPLRVFDHLCPTPDMPAPPEGCMYEVSGQTELENGCMIDNYVLVCE